MIALLSALIAVSLGCAPEDPVPQASSRGTPSQGVVLRQEGLAALDKTLAARVTSAPASVMNQPGLAAAMGGAHLRLLESGAQEVILPMPQLAGGQVPLCYFIRSTPPEAVVECRLRKRDDSNEVVSVRIKGERDQEVQIDWSAVVLVAGKAVTPDGADPALYRRSTACVQSEADEVRKIAGDLWPEDGRVAEYAANIQRFIREMKQTKQPRSLDALGLLGSGANGICTANANLASALLRAKGIASRSVAVIPTVSQRLEMHRIVEYFDGGAWYAFDPSSLHTDVPVKPWQDVIMAMTTVADEDAAMKPRMGSMLGCPYAQELESMSKGISPWGQDFYWTLAKPLAEFQPTDDTIALAVGDWKQYLETGALTPEQVRATTAANAAELLEMLKTE